MKLKILGTAIANPSDNNIGTATLVRVVTSAAVTLTLKASGGSTIGTVRISSGGMADVVKKATDTISCATSFATKVAYIS